MGVKDGVGWGPRPAEEGSAGKLGTAKLTSSPGPGPTPSPYTSFQLEKL